MYTEEYSTKYPGWSTLVKDACEKGKKAASAQSVDYSGVLHES